MVLLESNNSFAITTEKDGNLFFTSTQLVVTLLPL